MRAHGMCPLLLLTVLVGCRDGATPSDASAGDGGAADGPVLVPDGGPDGVGLDAGPTDVAARVPDGSSDGRGADGPGSTAGAMSYVVEGRLTATSMAAPVNPSSPPSRHDFTLRLDPAAGTVLIGGAGTAVRAAVTSSDGRTFRTNAVLTAPVPAPFACGGIATARYDSFSITIDSDTLVGSASGRMEVIVGDVGRTYDVTLAMSGRRDDVSPSFGPDLTNVDPLDGLILPASEPLPPGATARLGLSGVAVDLIPMVAPAQGGWDAGAPMGSIGVVMGFRKPDQALAYGATYRLTVAPAEDLAGNVATAFPTISTVAPPAMIAEDGFEGAGTAAGGAPIVERPLLPPIAGSRSAVVAAQDVASTVLRAQPARFTARLVLQASDRVVRLSVRPLTVYGGSAPATLRVAVPGGPIVTQQLPTIGSMRTMHTVPGGPVVSLGPVQQIEVALPAGARDAVVVDVRGSNPGTSCGLFPPSASYLIDDVRAE